MHNRIKAALVALAVAAGLIGAVAPAQASPVHPSINGSHRLPPSKLPQDGVVHALSGGGSTWVWAGGQQLLSAGTTAGGAAANVLVAEPWLDTTNDPHSLSEVAVRDTATGNTIEVGWTIDQSLNGDVQAHLFTGAWKLGVFLGYNATATGYTDNSSNATNAGANLHAVATNATFTSRIKKFLIQYDNTVACGSDPSGGWWVSYDNVYVGCYQNSIWGAGAFTHVDNALYFGEVATNRASGKPCSDMGNGNPGNTAVLPLDATDPAFFSSTSWVNPNPAGTASSNTLYNIDSNSNNTAAAYDAFSLGSTGNRTFTDGGKGNTSTGTTPGTKGAC
jgi:hypothetical protein